MEFEDDYYVEESSVQDSSKKAYVVLTEKDIIARLDEDINTICSAIHVSKGAARILLTNFKWNIDDVTDAWFADQEQVMKDVGLLQESARIGHHGMDSAKGVNKFTCSICFSDYSRLEMVSGECEHLFCKDCYKSYVESKIGDGHVCVTLKCPQPNCVAAVLDDVVETLVSDEFKERFDFYVVRSYIEEKRNIKWCPSPGCDCAIEFELGSEHCDVECDCSYMFCWNCVEEIHTPVDCETVEKWLAKNKDASSNSLWIFAYTKPCPKCKKPIEKNMGCMHMTCPAPCGHHFCWVCLGDWVQHQNYYKCNVYNGEKENSGVGSEKNRRETAKLLERYTHYYERWALNQSSSDKAVGSLNDWKSKIDMWEVIGKTAFELQFVTEAWLQIIECRRVLKWTYAYAFYMNEEAKGKKKLFEYLQGEAEAGLERLHHCAEKELEDYLRGDGEKHDFKIKVIELTKATNRFFGNLVRALENGLEDVKDPNGCGYDDDIDYYAADDRWDCRHCTFSNDNPAAQDCEICLLPRQ